jgi:nucleoside permease NupC
MFLLVNTVLLYHANAKLDGMTITVIVSVLLLAIIGLISLFRLGFGAVEPSLTPKQKEGMGALPLLLVAVGITLLICYFLTSKGQQ